MSLRYNKFGSYRYLNGNYLVVGNSKSLPGVISIQKRALRVNEELHSEFPDSIDLKITNRCKHGCPFCHESSTPDGKNFDLPRTIEILSQLPKVPIEIAIGGGNVLECFSELKELTEWLVSNRFRPRLTLNYEDLKGTGNSEKDKEISDFLNDYIEGLGISIQSLPKTKSRSYYGSRTIISTTEIGSKIEYGPYLVAHVIAGIFSPRDLKTLVVDQKLPTLVLGYKQWGRAKNDQLPDMTETKKVIREIIDQKMSGNSAYNLSQIAFDNLACEQLGIKEMMPSEIWEGIYLGDEGSCSMYIDAVRGEYARTSRSGERVSWNDIKLLDYYASLSK